MLQPPELMRQPAISPEDMDMFDLAMLFYWLTDASLVPAPPVQPVVKLPAFERWVCDALCAEDSAFALEEAPTQQEETTLMGIPSPVPYADH